MCVSGTPPPTQVAAFHPDLSNSGNVEHQGDPRDSGDNTAWLSLPARTPRTPVGGPRWEDPGGGAAGAVSGCSAQRLTSGRRRAGVMTRATTPRVPTACWEVAGHHPPVSRVVTLMRVTQCRVQLGMEPGLD